MKAKKILKKLDGVEAVLSEVIGEFAGNNGAVRKLLVTAKENVVHAKAKVGEKETPAPSANISQKRGAQKRVRASGSSRQAASAAS